MQEDTHSVCVLVKCKNVFVEYHLLPLITFIAPV
jgi:hypothetical protein